MVNLLVPQDEVNVDENDIGVTLEETAGQTGQSLVGFSPTIGSEDGSSDDDMGRDEDAMRRAAHQLLRRENSKVVIRYKDDRMLLFDCSSDQDSEPEGSDDDEGNGNKSTYPIICQNSDISHSPCNMLMAAIRSFLQTYYGPLQFASNEIMLCIPLLDITICEDNAYNNQVSFDDILTIFDILRERSKEKEEANVPTHLEAEIKLRPRFVARYNALVELTDSSATLNNIKPFSNDSGHPLVLDDSGPQTTKEVEVMDLDDDDDDEDEGRGRPSNEEKKTNEMFVRDSDSDELLEIVSDEGEINKNAENEEVV
ncbi:Rmr1p KNAG_0I00160 [Huiozyma naganishii CBS 8797]|uniref:Reduced meiotic recombination protein 1 n=1 Tax=Huiozyma naganishii (strain ATCC MYA-139 / BCRC 22969 / CBS 8797 / KCTC 17520 / NBRC 10181 / NCYC 3082 / Yp74L-3) TaxID=1071383 RepID=J7RPX2_HUIN7|nr:hypothetical protein KNAG_0I00160 [Kazachstania naganishii CBS 8797]CCK71808.1 hypothetical protein KNAG_0I00160 [Kazachstania naganishii CBS 8797]